MDRNAIIYIHSQQIFEILKIKFMFSYSWFITMGGSRYFLVMNYTQFLLPAKNLGIADYQKMMLLKTYAKVCFHKKKFFHPLNNSVSITQDRNK